MTVENANYVGELDQSLPTDDNDFVFEGDDHFRLVKKTLVQSFAAVLGAVNASHTEMNALVGITGNIENRLNDLPFVTGTIMMFVQSSAPIGWTIDATHDDRIIRVDGTEGGTAGGSWIISGLSGDGHVLTANQSGIRDHMHVNAGVPSRTNFPSGPDPNPLWGQNPRNSLGVVGGSQDALESHSHGVSSDGSWRPLYVDVIVCVKD